MRYRRRPTRSSSATLLVTFVLGVGIGFSLCYAILEIGRSSDVPAQTSPAGTEVSPPAAVPATSDTPDQVGNTAALTTKPAAPPEEATQTPDEHAWAARHLVLTINGADGAAAWEEYRPGGVLVTNAAARDAALGLELPDTWIAARYDHTLLAALIDQPVASPRALADDVDPEGARARARSLGEALAAAGIDVVFGPPLDVYQPDVSPPALAERTYADTVEAVSAYTSAVLDGLINGGVLPIAGHYPGLGHAHTRTRGLLRIDEADLEALARTMTPFVEAIEQDVPGLLVGRVAVPIIEDGGALVPAPFSERLVRLLLRERRGYTGVVLAGDITPIASFAGGVPQAVVAALAAGCDAVVLAQADAAALAAVCGAVAGAIEQGRLERAELDAAADRLATLARESEPMEAPSEPEIADPSDEASADKAVSAEAAPDEAAPDEAAPDEAA
ncbi:MAG: glycoside hydrolase family 3 N-terminal domain-containing protein, partial [Candidatus Hydrogenedentota bacterium]